MKVKEEIETHLPENPRSLILITDSTELTFDEKLEALTDKALRNLEMALDTAETTSDFIKSAEAILDRTGHARKREVQTEGTTLVGEAIMAAFKGLGEVFGVDGSSGHPEPREASDQRTFVVPHFDGNEDEDEDDLQPSSGRGEAPDRSPSGLGAPSRAPFGSASKKRDPKPPVAEPESVKRIFNHLKKESSR